MKKLLLFSFALLTIVSLQAMEEGERTIVEGQDGFYKVQETIDNLDGSVALQENLEKYRNDLNYLKNNIKNEATFEEKIQNHKIEKIRSDATEQRQKWIEQLENNKPDQLEKAANNQKKWSIWKGVFGIGTICSAFGLGWLAKQPNAKLGNISFPEGITTQCALFGVAAGFGFLGYKNIRGAVGERRAGIEKLEFAQKAHQNWQPMHNTLKNFDLFKDFPQPQSQTNLTTNLDDLD